MKVTRDSPSASPKRNDNKKRKRTLGKLFSAFSRGRKPASSSSSVVDAVDVPKMAPSPRVNISSVSSTSSYGERPTQTTGRVTMAGAEVTPGRHYTSTELSEKGTQTAALPSAPSTSHYRRYQLPSDTSYSSYPKYRGGYPSSRPPKCDADRRHTAEMAAAAPSWARSGRHAPAMTAGRHKRPSTNEMDILSFFDTGSVDQGYAYKCGKENGVTASSNSREGTIQRLASSDSQSAQQQLMLEDRDMRSIDHPFTSSGRRSRVDCQPVEEVVEDASCADEQRVRPSATPFHLQTVKGSHKCEEGGGPSSFWYCEKMDKSKAKRIPDANECEPTDCCEPFFDPTKLSHHQAERLQQTRAGGIFTRPITPEEKRRLAKIGAIILATAGVAALIMLLVRYRRQAQLCKSMLGADECCDTKSCDTFSDDEDGVCIFEKFDKVKCQNNNFKAMMSHSEKLVEHDDRVCASQDFKKVTKRLKDQSEAKAKEIFCPCTDSKDCSELHKKKCFDNFCR